MKAAKLPLCAKCNKPVQRLESFEICDGRRGRRFVAYCHGERDTLDIPDRMRLDWGHVVPSQAFAKRAS